MARGRIRLATALTAVLAIWLLASCGGSDSTTGGSTSTPGAAGGGERSTGQGGAKASPGGEGKGGGGGGSAKSKPSGGQSPVATPLEVSGGGSAPFRTKGGDNSIQNFGEESDESELREAAEALHGFYVARAEEDWGRACSYLSKEMASQLTQLASRLKEPGKGCGDALHALTRPLPASVRRETTVVDARSLRHEGEQAFLIYYGAEKTPEAMPMKPEGGAWKVGGLAPIPLD